MSVHKTTPQTKSFIILFSIACVGVAAAFYIIDWFNIPVAKVLTATPSKQGAGKQIIAPPDTKASPKLTTSTEGWKTYTSSEYGISFMYPPTWKVREPSKSNGFTILTIDPGAKYDNVRIYISPSSYFALE